MTGEDAARTRLMPRPGAVLGLALATALGNLACGEDFAVVPVRNLERPSDMGFACLGLVDGPQGKVVTGRPMAFCHDPAAEDPQRIDLNNREQGTFGLATNTARGELAAVDFDLAEYRVSPLLDLDPRNPGYNQLPVGSLPEVISMSDDGCRAVTANRGSCDLSLVDMSRLMASQFPGQPASTGVGPIVTHVRFQAATAVLRAAPFEIAFLPTGQAATTREEARTTRPAPVCQDRGRAPDGPTAPWRALVTFPSCDVVALVSLPDGRITSSVRILPDGTVIDTLTNPPCATTCPGPEAAGAAPDPAAIGVGALAVVPEGNRAYVGAARSSFITALGIADDKLVILPDDGRVQLHEAPGGVTRLRLSTNPYGPNSMGFMSRFVGNRGEFLYAFARDGSVRVVDLNRVSGRERECDVNVDPNPLFQNIDAPCYPVIDRRPRRVLTEGPGLRIPPVPGQPDVAPPVPVDISFAVVGTVATGFLLGSNGQIYHVAVDGAVGAQSTGSGSVGTEPPTLPHNFRRVPRGSGSRAGGLPTVVGEPERQFTPNRIPFPTRVGFNSRLEGPRLENSGASQAYVRFPRVSSAVPEEFAIGWQGTLPGTERISARLDLAGPGTMTLNDPGADFCRSGVEEGDILALLGCEQDGDCDRDRRGLAVCHRPSPGAQGVCLPRDFVANEEKLRLCRPELSSRRRYEVKEVFRSRLSFGLKLDEVPLPRLYPCQNDTVCQPDGTHARNATTADPGFQCLSSAPGGEPRCLKRCGQMGQDGTWMLDDRRCRAGHVCADVGDAALGPLCVEAPTIQPECVPLQVAYRVQAGKAFLISSSALPYLGSRLEEPSTDPWGGRCVPDPARNPVHGQRIPLSAPHCKNIVDGPDAKADTVTALTPEAETGGWGNACLFRGPNGDAAGEQEHVKALFENPNVRFVLTNLEQYVGDAAAVFVTVEGGFSPLRVLPSRQSIDFRLGARIVTAPMDASDNLTLEFTPPSWPPYLFVVDQGRTNTSLSRGQILRVNPRPAQLFPGGFIDSPDSNSLFPIQ
jgi:hypothetical protein